MTYAFPTPSESKNPNRACSGEYAPLTLRDSFDALINLVAAAYRRFQHRRSLAQLATMEDRMLDDIGITRDDVLSALAAEDGLDPSYHLKLRADERQQSAIARRREINRRIMEG